MKANEAEVLGKYILGRSIDSETVKRYNEAVVLKGYDQSDSTTDFILRHPFWLPYLDAAHGLLNKNSLLRKKLILMFALLETTPEYHRKFLLTGREKAAFFQLFWYGITGVYYTLTGLIFFFLIKIIKKNES